MHIQYTKKSQKWCPKTTQGHQNEVPRGTWSHQNNENVEKVKSNENTCIYCTFERLGHQNSREFPFKNHQKTWLQSKCDFELFKSEEIWKMMQKGLQWETQNPSKITKNQFWSRLSGPLHPMITKIVKKWCPKTQNAWKMVSQDLEKSINLWSKMNEICLKRIMQLLNFPMISILQIFQIHQVCKSTVNWLPEGPAAGAKP